VRYRGIAKNLNELNVLFACANLLMVKRVQKDFLHNRGVSPLFLRVILAFGVKYGGKLVLSALDFYGIEIYV